MTDLLTPIQAALDLPRTPLTSTGAGALPSIFAVSDLACASIAAAGQALAELLYSQTGRRPEVSVDRRLASFWFAGSIRPQGWSLPSPWDPIAGDYPSRDGWIRLHTNAPHHRAAAPGQQMLDPGMVEERVLARGQQLGHVHPQRRHPVRVRTVQPISKIDKSVEVGLVGYGGDGYLCCCHDTAFVSGQCDPR